MCCSYDYMQRYVSQCGLLVIYWLSSVCVCCACVARDELSAFMESAGASSPGVLKLTTSLSMPFTRLDKYSNLLKEVERHTDSAHADRGDTQRAISVYREIAVRSVACYVTADVYDVSAVAARLVALVAARI